MVNPCAAASPHTDYMNFPSERLIRESESNIEKDTLLDRATACLTLVVNRYHVAPSDTAARRMASIALRHLGNLAMTRNVDYRKAYHDLQLARQIAESDNDSYQLSYIYNSLSVLSSFFFP